MMRSKRLQLIVELVNNNKIATQEELQTRLKAAGYDVTQATVSRDISLLKLKKVNDKTHGYHYITQGVGDTPEARFKMVFADSVINITPAKNIIVIKTYYGLANSACAAFDGRHFKNVVGTLAGDDTVLVVLDSDEHAEQLVQQLKEELQ